MACCEHILRLADEPGYRRHIKTQANLPEGRHVLARKIFHGRAAFLAGTLRACLPGAEGAEFPAQDTEPFGSDAGSGDRFGHAAWKAGAVMTISNSTGVSLPRAACLRRRW
ncbi:Tn3 family transposase [Streptomyces noursei]